MGKYFNRFKVERNGESGFGSELLILLALVMSSSFLLFPVRPKDAIFPSILCQRETREGNRGPLFSFVFQLSSFFFFPPSDSLEPAV